MVGMNIKGMLENGDAFEALLARAREAAEADFHTGELEMDIQLVNKYTGIIPCHVKLSMGGKHCQYAFSFPCVLTPVRL